MLAKPEVTIIGMTTDMTTYRGYEQLCYQRELLSNSSEIISEIYTGILVRWKRIPTNGTNPSFSNDIRLKATENTQMSPEIPGCGGPALSRRYEEYITIPSRSHFWGSYLGQQLCMLASYCANNVGLNRPRPKVEEYMDIA